MVLLITYSMRKIFDPVIFYTIRSQENYNFCIVSPLLQNESVSSFIDSYFSKINVLTMTTQILK